MRSFGGFRTFTFRAGLTIFRLRFQQPHAAQRFLRQRSLVVFLRHHFATWRNTFFAAVLSPVNSRSFVPRPRLSVWKPRHGSFAFFRSENPPRFGIWNVT